MRIAIVPGLRLQGQDYSMLAFSEPGHINREGFGQVVAVIRSQRFIDSNHGLLVLVGHAPIYSSVRFAESHIARNFKCLGVSWPPMLTSCSIGSKSVKSLQIPRCNDVNVIFSCD